MKKLLLFLSCVATAAATDTGNALIPRSQTDTLSGGYYISLGRALPAGEVAVSWSFYGDPVQNGRSVTPILWDFDGAQTYTIRAIGAGRASTGGVQTYPFAAQSGDASAGSSTYLGWYDGRAGAANVGVIPFDNGQGLPGTMYCFPCSQTLTLGARFAVSQAYAGGAFPGWQSVSNGQRAYSIRVLTAPRLDGKLTLGDRSVAAPSMALTNSGILMAFAGTDGNQSVNLLSGLDPLGQGTKLTLADSSVGTPALAVFGDTVYVAWTGPAPASRITVASTADGRAIAGRVALTETSGAAPALAVYNGRLYLAWTGTDPNRSLNVMSSSDGRTFTGKVTISGPGSFSGPALVALPDRLVLASVQNDSARRLAVRSSADGASFTDTVLLTETSAAAPALTTLPLPFGSQLLYLSWADPGGTLNLIISTDGTSFAQKSIVAETSGGSPAVILLAGQMLIAWTETDAEKHMSLYYGAF